jgi:hypothetical protein
MTLKQLGKLDHEVKEKRKASNMIDGTVLTQESWDRLVGYAALGIQWVGPALKFEYETTKVRTRPGFVKKLWRRSGVRSLFAQNRESLIRRAFTSYAK